MSDYSVYEPPEPPADRLDRAESLEFVKEGFSWLAAIFTPFWLLAHRMWIVLAAYIVLAIALQLGLVWSGINERLIPVITIALHLLIGFEADTLRRWTMERNGWRMIGSVLGRNSGECERRFFEAWLPTQPYVRADALSPAGGSLPLSSTGSGRRGWRSLLPFSS